VVGSILSALFLGDVLIPAMAFAKENETRRESHASSNTSLRVSVSNGEQKKAEVKANVKNEVKIDHAALLAKLKLLVQVGSNTPVQVPFSFFRKGNFWDRLENLINHGTTTRPLDTTAPVLSGITVTNLSSTTAKINWTSNEKVKIKLLIATSSSSSVPRVIKTDSGLRGSIKLKKLTTNTTYYFTLVAKDKAGNTSTSTQMSFSTGTPPPVSTDTTAPILSSIIVSNVSSTSARITWNTNENATGKVYYSTTTPTVGGAGTKVASTTALSSFHDFTLGALASSTTYHFFVTSTDGSNNTASSSVVGFTTGN